MPFPPKNFEKPGDPGLKSDEPGIPSDESAPERGRTPAKEPASVGPSVKSTSSKPSGSKGTSAPLTPGQGVPDVKPHEESTKKEPESDDEKLPGEADEAAAKEQPKGLPSLAVMTKSEAEAAVKDPMNNPHVQRLAQAVHQLAKLVQAHHAQLGAMGQNTEPQAVQPGAPTQPGQRPMTGAGRPAMGAGRMPGQQMQRPGMAPPGAPVAGAGLQRPGMSPTGTPQVGGAQAMTPTLALDQIREMMTIMEAAKTGRIPAQGAALLIGQGFGLAPEIAAKMVAGDMPAAAAPGQAPDTSDPMKALAPAAAPAAPGAPAPAAPAAPGAPAPAAPTPAEVEEDDGLDENGRSQFAREYEDEDGLDVDGRSHFAREYGPFDDDEEKKRTDAADDLSTIIDAFGARHADVVAKLEALRSTMALIGVRSDEWDESLHPRDENGKFTDGGGGGGKREGTVDRLYRELGGKGKREGTVPHTSLDPFWRSKKPEAEDKTPDKPRALNKLYHAEARRAEAAGNRAKAERLFALADAVRGERAAIKARMREEVKRAAEQFKKYPKEHPATPKQGKDEYFKTNAHPANIERLRDPKPVGIKYLGGGVNDTMKITMQDGSKATWKPVHGEASYMRTNVPTGKYYIREAAASDVARVLGVQDLVPAVVAFHGPEQGYRNTTGVVSDHGPFGRPADGESPDIREAREAGVAGSLHAWAPGTSLNDLWNVPELDRDAVERARVFDYITGNSDRHGGNMLVNERDGKHFPVLIDNGLSFNTKGVPDRAVFPYETLGWEGLLDSTREMIKNIDTNEVTKTLKASGLERDAAKLVIQRLLHIKADPDWLDSKGNGSAARFAYDFEDHNKKARALKALEPYEALAEEALRGHDGTRR